VSADFRRFFLAAALSKAGTQISSLAVPLVAVLTLDATPGEVGLLAALHTVAFLLVGLPAGAWLDRMCRRPVLVAADLFRAGLLATIPVAWALDMLTLHLLYAVVLLNSVATVFFDIAAASYLPHLVSRAGLVAANARLTTVESAGHVAGPAAGGWLVQVLGPPLAIAIDAASYLWSAVWLVSVRRAEAPPEPRPRRRLAAEIREGLAFVRTHAVLRAVVLAGGLTNVALAASFSMIPIVLVRELGYSEGVLGAYLAVSGLGGLLGAATARPLAQRLGEAKAVWLLGIAVAPVAVLVPLVGHVPVALAAAGWAVVAYKVSVDNVLLVTFRQQVTPDPLLGRVNATVRVLLTGCVTAGAAAAGLLGQLAGPRAALWLSAAVLAVTWVPVFRSPLRKNRTLVRR
jgi:predicted MFS family arabinose efflux permease